MAPLNEERRLKALRLYDVLDTEPEEALDDLTALAATICAVPMALISLVDAQRQWFKSRVGMEAVETPREVSFCVHALGQPELMIVPDATLDPRFAQNPLVTGEPGVRFYAGAPLVTPEGEALGTLCVMDVVPRTLSPAQAQALRVLGRQVMTHLNLRRQAQTLAREERLLRAIFDAEPECVKLLSADGKVQMMNRAGLGIIEADSFEQVDGKSVFPLIAAEDRGPFEALTERVFRGEAGTLEYRIAGLKGTPRWLETHAAPLRDERGAVTAAVGVTRDVSEQHRAQAALRERGELLQAIFDNIPVMLCFIDRVGRMEWVNREAERVFGWTLEEIQAHADIFAEWYPDAEYRAGVRKFIGEATGKFREFRTRTRSGVVPTRWASVRLGDGTNVGIGLDITEQKRSEDRFRWLVDSNAQGVMFWHTNGKIMDANEAFLRMVGYSREELEAGRVNWTAITPAEDADRDRRALEEIAATGVCAPFEKELIRQDGSRASVFIGAAGFADNPAEGVAFLLDLTERKQLEQHALRAQRMESIGTLAGGIAHDLNNVLSPIMMSLEVLKLRFPDPQSRELLAILDTSAQRGADMVRQILSFARGVEGRRMEVQVGHLIAEIEKFANDTFLKNIAVRTVIPHDLWTVLGDPTQLHQVLLNLCVNARDAMPEGGRLTISAENRNLDAHYAAMNPGTTPGLYIFLQVEDTGTGMPPAVIEKIFDPFFTTKEVGRGTGLGLSTSLGIVKSHGGFVRVYSEVGKGTKFQIHLPAQTGSSPAAAAGPLAAMPRGHGELILVVDDESSVRQVTQRTLEAFGYRVVLAADGVDAVAVFARQGAEIAAVLTDMTMPVMDGPATIRVLRRMNPAVRIIATSGLSANSEVARASGLRIQHFLTKPYTAQALLKVLQQTLSGDR